ITFDHRDPPTTGNDEDDIGKQGSSEKDKDGPESEEDEENNDDDAEEEEVLETAPRKTPYRGLQFHPDGSIQRDILLASVFLSDSLAGIILSVDENSVKGRTTFYDMVVKSSDDLEKFLETASGIQWQLTKISGYTEQLCDLQSQLTERKMLKHQEKFAKQLFNQNRNRGVINASMLTYNGRNQAPAGPTTPVNPRRKRKNGRDVDKDIYDLQQNNHHIETMVQHLGSSTKQTMAELSEEITGIQSSTTQDIEALRYDVTQVLNGVNTLIFAFHRLEESIMERFGLGELRTSALISTISEMQQELQ
ncbi:hypothetical protein BGZ51_007011, partial [Haplosporangium sp. Z 767]